MRPHVARIELEHRIGLHQLLEPLVLRPRRFGGGEMLADLGVGLRSLDGMRADHRPSGVDSSVGDDRNHGIRRRRKRKRRRSGPRIAYAYAYAYAYAFTF